MQKREWFVFVLKYRHEKATNEHLLYEGKQDDEWALKHLRYEACFSAHQKMELSFLPGT